MSAKLVLNISSLLLFHCAQVDAKKSLVFDCVPELVPAVSCLRLQKFFVRSLLKPQTLFSVFSMKVSAELFVSVQTHCLTEQTGKVLLNETFESQSLLIIFS